MLNLLSIANLPCGAFIFATTGNKSGIDLNVSRASEYISAGENGGLGMPLGPSPMNFAAVADDMVLVVVRGKQHSRLSSWRGSLVLSVIM